MRSSAPTSCNARGGDLAPAEDPPHATYNLHATGATTLRLARRPELAALAEKLRRLQAAWRPAAGCCPTGLTKLDEALGGGFALGCIHELLAPTQGAPARSLALWAAARRVPGMQRVCHTLSPTLNRGADFRAPADGSLNSCSAGPLHPVSPPSRSNHAGRRGPALQTFTSSGVSEQTAGDAARLTPEQAPSPGQREWVLYIDTGGDFYPPAAARLGLPLERFLVVRTRQTADALWTCEQALRCPAIAAVILPIRTVDAYVSRRLQLAAEATGGLGFLLRSELRGGHTFAATRLRIDPLPTGRHPTPRMPAHCTADTALPPSNFTADTAVPPSNFTADTAVPHGAGAATNANEPKDPILCPAKGGTSEGQQFDPPVGADNNSGGPETARRLQVTLLKLRDGHPAGPFELVLPFAATIPRQPPTSRSPRHPLPIHPPNPSVASAS